MMRLLKTTAKTVASVLAVFALLSSTSYAGQKPRHHEQTATALRKDCRWVFLFWRSCTYSYVGANQVSKIHAKLPNSEIAVGFYTGSVSAGRTGRPTNRSSSARWGNTSTDVGFARGSTFGSSHGSGSGGTTGGSLAVNNGQRGSEASNQGGSQGGHEGGSTNAGSTPSGEDHQQGTGSTAGGSHPGSGTGAGDTPSSPSNTPAHSDNGNGNDPGHSDPSNPGQSTGNGSGNGVANENGNDNSTHADNGHGNDPDHTDPSNPGQGGGNHGAGNKGK
ncbi:hypothetical protein JNB88_30715 [Rhizobium cauense]|uniref:hypothetical protein n=1 Tax=Rhizobium cauense TaxID=1166683 RepID=UPI001C6E74B6|nr:hypothetical protein [Rhizobium cauense]MBW9117992.1 hypothetical protein [Rhizobium cauense]